MKNSIRLLLILISLCAALPNVQAQGWEKKYSPDVMMGISSLYQMPNHGYFTTGFDLTNDYQQRVIKTDSLGNIAWQKDYPSPGGISFSNITQDGGMVVVGFGNADSIGFSKVALRISSAGSLLWYKHIYYYQTPGPNGGGIGNTDVDTTNNGGFICAVNAYDTTLNNTRIAVIRLDGNGDTMWTRSYYDTSTLAPGKKYVFCVRNAGDGGFIVGINLDPQERIFKIDAAGNFLWQYTLPGINQQSYPVIARDGNILIAGTNYINKISQTGQQLWLTPFPSLNDSISFAESLIELPGNVFATLLAENLTGQYRYSFVKVDSAGNILLQNRISTAQLGPRGDLYTLGNKTMIHTTDGGYAVGFWRQYYPNGYDGYSAAIIKMDSNGVVYPNAISGNVYTDLNLSCQQDSGEAGIANIIISFAGRDTFQVATDASGFYWAQMDTGSYTVLPTLPSSYWSGEPCNATQLVTTQPHTDTVLNFAVKELVDCPYITIDGGIFHIRTCIGGYYMMEYCNEGTAPLKGGVVEIDVDTLLVVDSASVALDSSNGNKYYYRADTLALFDCRTIIVYFHTPCNQLLDDRTACIYASVTPSTLCSPTPAWDQSYLNMSVDCDNQQDSVVFKLKNKGTGTMNRPEKLLVIEDNVILNSLAVQLNPGAEMIFKQPANGSTYRATVPQTPYNPASLFATAAIEGCGVNQRSQISKGFIIDFPFNGAEAFEHTTCSEINHSFDPNNKSATPVGVNDDHLIDTTTALEYTIEFQNTGTDTAYQVLVIDTLSPYLDPATVKPGLSSNKYNFQVSGNGILSFNFINIYLPDSGHNQLRSTGFVQFQVRQRGNNANGTVINNKASIVFDYNAPVITNNVFHTIGNLLVTGIENLAEQQVLISAYPNPFSDKTTIKVDGQPFNQLQLTVYDLTGQKVKQLRIENSNQFILNSTGFSMGNYIFEIQNGKDLIGRGKIVVMQ